MQYNLYRILNVGENATQQEIKNAYRSLAKLYHPDVSTVANAEQLFIVITEAYEILYDPAKRKRYDFTLNHANVKSTSENDKKRYEANIRKARARARKKANLYKNMEYKRFESEYFNSFSSYFFPKFFGCLGFGFAGLVALSILLATIFYFKLPIIIFGLAAAVFFLIAAYAGANFSDWHNEREKKRFKKRNSKK